MVATAVAVALGAAPCPHPYFPIEEGLRLTYRAGKSEIPIFYSEVKAQKDGIRGTVEMKVKGRASRTEARCDPEGIQTGAGGLEGLALQSSGMDVTIVKSEGLVLPPAAGLKPGATWTNSLTLQLRPPKRDAEAGGLKGALAGKMVLTTTIKKESTVVGREQVTTAAGTFDGLKVVNRTSANGGGSAGGQRSVESVMWLAPGLGIVKIMTGDSVDFELLKVERGQRAAADSGAAPPQRVGGPD